MHKLNCASIPSMQSILCTYFKFFLFPHLKDNKDLVVKETHLIHFFYRQAKRKNMEGT